ncbi:class I SAM-dependent DNA methyltransferase [Amycolatopsis lexingtonensis]|uniref:class I SAM-dependent DNA methyltransferase n=1 Tax=Amycolatopsis lexingtonensis TaxID=218822 RepID=UPI003F6F30CA
MTEGAETDPAANSGVVTAYDTLAPHYDRYSSGNDYQVWADLIIELAVEHGWTGKTVLDLGAGTGAIARHLSAHGFGVTALDASPAMIEEARRRGSDAVRFLVADMTDFDLGETFDLVVSTDDVLNYLLTPEAVRRALRNTRRHLAQDGLVIFDVNTLLVYRSSFAGCDTRAWRECVLVRHGHGSPTFAAGGRCDVDLTIIEPDLDDESGWRVRRTRHTQRHHPLGELREILVQSGFEVLGVLGPNHTTGNLDDVVDESHHNKAIFVARPRPADG